MKTKVFALLLAFAMQAGVSMAQPKSRILEDGGTGPYKAIMTEVEGLAEHTVFLPQDLSMNVLLMQTLEHHGFPFPIVLSPDTDELEEEKVPNARVRATLDRVLDGTEPMSGPFHTIRKAR